MGYLNLGHSRWGERFPALGKNWTAALLQAVLLAALAFGLGDPKPANAQTVTLAQPSAEQTAKIGAIFDWALAQPSIFPYLSANVATQTAQGYVFRGYPTGNYLAATATDLYAYGPATNFVLLHLGAMDQFYCSIVICPPKCESNQEYVPGIGACAYKMGVVKYPNEAKLVPKTCLSQELQCWKDQVARGDIIWFLTTATIHPYNTRPIVIAFYKKDFQATHGEPAWNTHLVYADNGEKVTGNDIQDGGFAMDMDWIVGNSLGVLMYDRTTLGGTCWQFKWNPPSTEPNVAKNVWGYFTLTCPQ